MGENLNYNYADAYYNRGVLYREKGDYKEAIKDNTSTLRINPDKAAAYNNRGISKYFLGLDGCPDLKKAEALGGYVHPDAMKEICN